MKKIKFIHLALIVLLPAIFFWSCASEKKAPKTTPVQAPSSVPDPSPLPSGPATTESSSAEAPEALSPPSESAKDRPSSEELLQEGLASQEEEAPADSSSQLLEEALTAYQESQNAWERGDIDAALAALDETYRIILDFKLSPDSPLNQDKNDLRLLIARRIQEVYASQLSAINGSQKTIPLVENKYVSAEIQSFQTHERKYFEEAYKRSGLYRPMILEEIQRMGLPEELSWIPMIESWFKVKAYSRARALGLWQFISSTGYRFGLKRDRWVDERMDPLKSTQAALQYLQELHSFFGDWTTALAAYNCGEFKVQRVIRAQRINYLDNFWDLFTMLPRETARFVPRFIATLLIIQNPEKYGFNLPSPDPPLQYEIVEINWPVKLSTLSQNLGLNSESLAALNPDLRHNATPDHEYLLKVPQGYAEAVLAKLDSVPRWIPPEATYVIHYVRRGDTVSGIAQRYRTTVSAIARLNNLRRSYLIRPGQKLKIPASGASVSLSSSRSFDLSRDGEKLVYVVKRGDSLYLIARAFNTSVQKIKQMNNLTSNVIHVGQKLRIMDEKANGASLYTVKAGDTPFEIARKFGMRLDTLLRLNGLNRSSKIYPGQKLWVHPD